MCSKPDAMPLNTLRVVGQPKPALSVLLLANVLRAVILQTDEKRICITDFYFF